jgi:phosphate transport system substrate-binding protein
LLLLLNANSPTAFGADATNIAPLSGLLSSVGSDTMVYLISDWVVAFKSANREVRSYIFQSGSATAPPALLDGSATIAPMSRPMRAIELKAFERKYGYPPTEFRVAMDGLAVYVNKDNPIRGMTLAQLDAAFSFTRECGYPNDITSWGELGLNGAWHDRAIRTIGRNTLSGTYAFFAEHALCKGAFRSSLQMLPTSRDVVYAVAADSGAIGYSGVGYLMRDVRAIPIAVKPGQAYVAPTAENVHSGAYPLSRYLYIYVNKAPTQPLRDVEREFLRMALSDAGQAKITANGFIPLSAEVLREERRKLE